MSRLPEVQHARNGDVALASQVSGEGSIDVAFVQDSSPDGFETAGEHGLKGAPDRWRPYRLVA